MAAPPQAMPALLMTITSNDAHVIVAPRHRRRCRPRRLGPPAARPAGGWRRRLARARRRGRAARAFRTRAGARRARRAREIGCAGGVTMPYGGVASARLAGRDMGGDGGRHAGIEASQAAEHSRVGVLCVRARAWRVRGARGRGGGRARRA
jgi:hypothetical protein